MSLITSYSPLPIAFTHGKGVWLYDAVGQAYLDGFSGIAVCGLGHAHPEITQTIQEQAAKLIHTSNAFEITNQDLLAEKLTKTAQMAQVFFGNSGAEADEAAIKLARLHGHNKGIKKPLIAVMEGAFHGRTMATLSASGSAKVQQGFEPLLPGFVRVPFGCLDALKKMAAQQPDLVAVMLEPIQGEGGIHVAPDSYMQALAKLCDKHDWLLMLDEIQTGVGRTGDFYTYLGCGVKPDVVTTAKGLGNGYPIGACLMNGRARDLFKPGSHGSTFGGNPLASAIALKVIEVMARDNVCQQVQKNSSILRQMLDDALGSHPMVKGIRGKGFMIGVELNQPALAIKKIALRHQLLLNVTANTVVRLLPALIMTESELEQLVDRLKKTIDAFAALENQ